MPNSIRPVLGGLYLETKMMAEDTKMLTKPPNFNDHFFADGFDSNGNLNRHWYTNKWACRSTGVGASERTLNCYQRGRSLSV